MEGVLTVQDRVRGCGWRKEGGLYLIADGFGRECYKLPVPLGSCPTCGEGIKFSRGFTWIDADALLGNKPCIPPSLGGCQDPPPACTLADPHLGRAGLIWIGEQFYPTPQDFTREALRQGISRRIASVPRDFKLGETWILLAHLKAVWNSCQSCRGSGRVEAFPTFIEGLDDPRRAIWGDAHPSDAPRLEACPECEGEKGSWSPGIFHLFRPRRIEYVTTGDESQDEIDALIKRGITPVEIEKLTDQPPSPTRRASRGNQ